MSFLKNLRNSQQGGTDNNWQHLTSTDQIDEIIRLSVARPVVIFKHSTSCGISVGAKSRLESVPFDTSKGIFYYLDLIAYRPVSNLVAERFGVTHQSPQMIVIKDGKAVNNTSHHAISAAQLEEWLTV